MKRALITTVVLLLLSISVVAAVTGSYEMTWFTVDGGGGVSRSGVYTLVGTIGQAEAGASGNGPLSLSGGFLRQGALSNQRVFLPVIIKASP